MFLRDNVVDSVFCCKFPVQSVPIAEGLIL
jgi:hypothetical protein